MAILSSSSSHFVIRVLSNVDSRHDPDNTPSKFTTRLPRPVQLSGEWEVAATRLQYQNNWYNLPKKQLLGVYVRAVPTESTSTNTGRRDWLEGVVSRTAPASPEALAIESVIHRWQEESWVDPYYKDMNYRCIEFPAGHYATPLSVGKKLCALIEDAFVTLFPEIKLRYDQNRHTKVVELVSEKKTDRSPQLVVRVVTLAKYSESDLMRMLGFFPSRTGTVSNGTLTYPYRFYGSDGSAHDLRTNHALASLKTDSDALPEIPELRQLMLYCDVAAFTMVGNIDAQLLDTIIVGVPHSGREDALRGVKPNYVPVYRNSFDSIEIMLTDTDGYPLKFKDFFSPVMVTLQFRRVRN